MNGSDEVSELTELSEISSSTKLTGIISEKGWVDLIYFSGKGLMARTKTTVKLDRLGTSEASVSGMSSRG